MKLGVLSGTVPPDIWIVGGGDLAGQFHDPSRVALRNHRADRHLTAEGAIETWLTYSSVTAFKTASLGH